MLLPLQPKPGAVRYGKADFPRTQILPSAIVNEMMNIKSFLMGKINLGGDQAELPGTNKSLRTQTSRAN